MEFIIESTSICLDKLINEYPNLMNFGFSTKEVDVECKFGKRKETIATININTIEELMSLAKDTEYEIIVGNNHYKYEMPCIEIYDGYRE